MLTVEKFLTLATFEDLKLVSGKDGLNNIIESVNIMDNPSAIDWFSAGEMLLTSGYFFKDDPEMQNQLMERLHALNCPALCIKPHQFLGSIPENMIELSNQFNLPIIELPYRISFSSLFLRTMEEVSIEFDSFNRRVLDVQQHFFKISIHDGGLKETSKSLSNLLNSHVYLLDTDWKVLEWSPFEKDNRKVFLDLKTENNTPLIPKHIIESVSPESQNIENPITRIIETEGEKVPFVILPVYFNQIHYGFIVAIQTQMKWSRIEFDTMKSGAMTFALELIKIRESQRAKNRVRRDFLDELLTGKIKTMETLTNYADIHGVSLDLPYNAIVFDISFSTNLSPNDLVQIEQFENAKVKNILSILDTFNYHQDQNLIIYSSQKQIIILAGNHSPKQKGLTSIKELATNLIRLVEKNIGDVHLIAGIGKQYPHIIDVHKSFYEAQATLRLLKHSNTKKKVSTYDDFRLRHFLNRNINHVERDKFIDEVLGELIASDLENNSDLVATLDAWVANHLNTAQAARELYIHRNTLLYRIDKIKELLQLDIEDPENLLSIQLALNLRYLTSLE